MPISSRKICVGVCAMDKKARSKAMSAILTRLEKFDEFEVVVFGDEMILQKEVTEWPVVDALLSWFSDGFPLAKAERYSQLHKGIYMVNDLHRQWDLLDRRTVYKILKEHEIPTPPHIVANRNEPTKPGVMPTHAVDFPAEAFSEYEDYVEVDGERIDKPFVEKPADAENHNICIYYPHTVGGGYKALFRKVGNQASKYYPPPVISEQDDPTKKSYNLVRRETSFIYENFMSTGGTDVKVYTVGPNYAHAEARKSPVVDGRVQRDANGKEERFPVLLTPEEKEIARRVCLAFGQMVCGFDLLRTKGRSYVCDVNGWSFVKNSTKYFDDASLCLRAMILRAVAPDHKRTEEAAQEAQEQTNESDDEHVGEENEGVEGDTTTATHKTPKKNVKKPSKSTSIPAEELRAVLAVVRHGDRTPKQKMKMKVTHKPLLDLLSRCTSNRTRKQAKLKTPQRLQELLNICRTLYASSLKEGERFEANSAHETHSPDVPSDSGASTDSSSTSTFPRQIKASSSSSKAQTREEWEEELEQWKQVVSILQEGGHFSGINRKAQLKPLAWEPIPAAELEKNKAEQEKNVSTSKDCKESSETSSKKDDKKEPPTERVTEALLIIKFGGVLTHLGKNQAEFLGRDFRMRMYPGGNTYDQGITDGLLRLHSTYRHDLKIYSSDEGRVQITAAAFAKGLLDLETSNNQLTPILASLVNKDAKLLDFVTHEVEEDILHAKQKLYNIMTEGHVKGRGPNKEYSTSDTAVIDDDFERSGPVGYLRRNSATDNASPTKSGLAQISPEQKPRSYALMSADRARSLKMARKSLSRAASSAMSSLREAMLTAMASGITEDKPKDPSKSSGKTQPSPPRADDKTLGRRKKSADDLHELNRILVEQDAGDGDGSMDDGTSNQLPPSTTVSPSKSPAKSQASPTRGSIDEMAKEIGRVEISETAAAGRNDGYLVTLTDEEQEYRVSLDIHKSPSAHLPRSSWNAGEAKQMLKSRIALGSAELSTIPPDSPHKPATISRRTSLDVGSDAMDAISGDLKASVEGSITRRPPGVPPEPLKLLRVMVDLIGGVTRQLREEIFKHEKDDKKNESDIGSPNDAWVDTLGALAPRGSMPAGGLAALMNTSVPAGGESFLLMHARWKKLEQDIYHPRKGRFDISKVPDVYDSAKYDAIHNSHLELEGLEELYRVSRCLAEGVVPNEYGTHPQSKLRIGGTIAHSLLLKLLQDMFTTREESFVGLVGVGEGALSKSGDIGSVVPMRTENTGQISAPSDSDTGSNSTQTPTNPSNSPLDEEDEAALKEEEEIETSTTRLNHRYANTIGVNSPHRHVRTRLYFTSESHIHSLLNVLRYCNLEAGSSRRDSTENTKDQTKDIKNISNAPPSLLSRSVETLENIGDLDYLTHIVFRMYERFDVDAVDPTRFRLEILLSTGVGLDPFKQNVISEFELAAADASRREKESASPILSKQSKSKTHSSSKESLKLPLLRQFPIQNDRAHGGVSGAGVGTDERKSETSDKTNDSKKGYLTLNDLESYLWKFRKNRLTPASGASGSGTTSDVDKTPTKPQKSQLGGPKRTKKKKKKGSDSDSE